MASPPAGCYVRCLGGMSALKADMFACRTSFLFGEVACPAGCHVRFLGGMSADWVACPPLRRTCLRAESHPCSTRGYPLRVRSGPYRTPDGRAEVDFCVSPGSSNNRVSPRSGAAGGLPTRGVSQAECENGNTRASPRRALTHPRSCGTMLARAPEFEERSSLSARVADRKGFADRG